VYIAHSSLRVSASETETAAHGARAGAAASHGVVSFAERRLKLDNPELTFLVVGDWGRQGGYQDREVGQASASLFSLSLSFSLTPRRSVGKVAELSGASFVLSVGDNVYESGLTNETDPWFDETFTKIYTHPGLATLPWYVMQGNHEYYGNSSAILADSLHGKDARWHPVRSNLQTFAGKNGSTLLTLASVDTSPFLSKYRKDDMDWRGLTPVVLPGDTPVAGEGIDPAPNAVPPPTSALTRAARWMSASLFGAPNFEQPTKEAWAAWGDAQLAQLEGWLAGAERSSAWTFVSGHHPIQSYSGKAYGPKDLAGIAGLLSKYEVPLYFNGHNHNLQWIKQPEVATHFICSGAGSLVDPDVVDPGDGTLIYGDNGAGFVVVQMDYEATVITFVDADAKVLYENTVFRSDVKPQRA